MMNDVTQIAKAGYAALNGTADNPYLWSSDNWLLFELGAYLRRTGRTAPRDVSKSRGYSVNTNGMRFKWIDGTDTDFERVK